MQIDHQAPLLRLIEPAGGSLTRLNSFWFRGNLPQLEAKMPASRDEYPFPLTHRHPNISPLDLARDRPPGKGTVQVLIAVALILVKRGGPASLGRIEHERQRVRLLLADIVHLRPQRHRGVGPHVDGRLAQRSVGQNVRRAIYARSGPEVNPAPRGKVDVSILPTGTGDSRYQQRITAHELVVHRVGRGVFAKSPEQRPH